MELAQVMHNISNVFKEANCAQIHGIPHRFTYIIHIDIERVNFSCFATDVKIQMSNRSILFSFFLHRNAKCKGKKRDCTVRASNA